MARGTGEGKPGYDNARRAAVAALLRVHRGGWANMAAGALDAPGLSGRDRAFAGALFFGTAERLETLDYLLSPFLKKPVGKLDAEVRAVLECGLYQLLYMRVPASAAVNESVKLARAFGKSSASGMVNAVLRRCAGQYATVEGGGPDLAGIAFESELQRVCVTHSVGGPVAQAVMRALPDDYDAFLAASFSKGELCLRANTLKTDADSLIDIFAGDGMVARPGGLPGALYASLPGGVAAEPSFKQGLYHVQGEASQYVCACVAPQPGDRVLDICAAPGGKSATLAQMLGGGTGLTACDIWPHRVELIRTLFERLGIEGADVLTNDGTEYNAALAGQDRVLCDVPCSGLGVLAQKSDLRYNDGSRFSELPALQMKVLDVSSRYVKKGGRLVYSTCTVRREENEDVVRAFLDTNESFRLVGPAAAPKGAITADGMVTILPHCTGLDGFFVATMERL